MDYGIERRIWGCFLLDSFDLPMLIGQIFGFDARLYAVIMGILSFIAGGIFCHCLFLNHLNPHRKIIFSLPRKIFLRSKNIFHTPIKLLPR